MIVKTLPVGDLFTNCYLVGCERTNQAAVIDPGGEAVRILTTAQSAGLAVAQILLTHAHFDHMAAAAGLMQATGAPLFVHPAEQPLLAAGGGATLFGFPAPDVPAAVSHLADGQDIAIGDVVLQVIHTPGHSPGSVCFYAASEGILFDGDVLFANGIGRTDLPGGQYATLMQSLERLMSLPDATVVYPGHGPATTIGQERTGNVWI
jgi:glyoxylase-like metal-dependent hydrolase (beta-lactamase superfamily II)